jgi:hypothetical protein
MSLAAWMERVERRFAPSSISPTGEARRPARRPNSCKKMQGNPNKSKEKSLDFGGIHYAHGKHKAELRRSIAL